MLRPYTVPVTLDLLPLLLAALALGIEVDARQLARVVVEDLEPSLARGERTIIECAGRELPVDPAHHPVGGDAVPLVRPGAGGEAVQYVRRGPTVGRLVSRVVRSWCTLAVRWGRKRMIAGVIAAVWGWAGGSVIAWSHLGALVAVEPAIAVEGEGLARLSSRLKSRLGDVF